MAALLVTVAVANLLWAVGVPSAANPARMDPGTDAFPLIPEPNGLHVHVLPVPASTNESTRLTLLSIQGLVNRGGAELYLDFANETANASSMLSFLVARYGVTYDVVSLDWVYAHYLPVRSGLVVIDPTRPESVNIGTMVASLDDAVLAGPDTAADLEAQYGLPAVLTYGASNWTSTSSITAYDRALADLYPRLGRNLLAILPPDRLDLRDYLIATRTFVFYEPQGVLASPAALAATQRVLAAAPRGVPILGWFDSPTLTEENGFIQLASQYGKPVFGSQDVPNLSVLTAFGRNRVRMQAPPPPAPPLENKTYAVVSVPDGDNLDFIARRMPQLWAEPERGTFPIAWSLSPLLADLAPPYLDYYYGSATSGDRFVLGPSGAGYLYPDYLGPGDLAPYLKFTARYANATGMDVAWLLNAFVASEIPYSSATLSAYVDALHPRGLVLDYDDQAKTQETWMQGGATATAPVIRSTQLWTTTDNFFAKVGDAMATWDTGAHFLWITIYTFRFDLHDAATLIRELSNRTGRDLVVVTPEQLFALLEEDFVVRAHAQLAAMRAEPFASALLGTQLDAAQGWLDSTAGPGGTANDAYNATLELREAGLYEGSLALGLVVVAAAFVTLAEPRRERRTELRAVVARGRPLLLLAAAFALFMLALRAGLATNFWSYQWIVVGVAVSGIGRPLRRYLDRAYPRFAFPALIGLDLCLVALALETNVAFPLAAVATVAVIDAGLSRETVNPGGIVVAASIGTAVGFVAGIDLLSFLVLAASLLLVPIAASPARPAAAIEAKARIGYLAGFILSLPMFVLAAASNFALGLRLQISGADLSAVAAAVLALGPLAGILAARRWTSRPHAVRIAGFGLTAIASLALGFVTGTVATMLLLAAVAAGAAVAAEATLKRFVGSGLSASAALSAAVVWIPLFLLFFRMPPVVYSLTVVRLPEAFEAALYAPEFPLAAIAALLAVAAFRGWVRARSVGKDYPPSPSVREGRSS